MTLLTPAQVRLRICSRFAHPKNHFRKAAPQMHNYFNSSRASPKISPIHKNSQISLRLRIYQYMPRDSEQYLGSNFRMVHDILAWNPGWYIISQLEI